MNFVVTFLSKLFMKIGLWELSVNFVVTFLSKLFMKIGLWVPTQTVKQTDTAAS